MKTTQLFWTEADGWSKPTKFVKNPQLIFVFGCRDKISIPDTYHELRSFFPTGSLVFASTSGEIIDSNVLDNSIVVAAIEFEKTEVVCSELTLEENQNSFDAGKLLVSKLPQPNLKHVLIISEGTFVNGSELVKGMTNVLPKSVSITGGLAGDGDRFQTTVVGLNKTPTTKTMVAIGLYGDVINIGYGSVGGWDTFGPVRIVTKSQDNILYTLDDIPALELYKKYLGEFVSELPSSALLFPLSIQFDSEQPAVVRTILGIDEVHQTMTFAGDIPVGAKAQLMKANFDKIIEAASFAAETGLTSFKDIKPELAICVSCVGRKLILGPRVSEEVEEIKSILGENPNIIGFYSHGELAPFGTFSKCELHNQTMTVTLLSETL